MRHWVPRPRIRGLLVNTKLNSTLHIYFALEKVKCSHVMNCDLAITKYDHFPKLTKSLLKNNGPCILAATKTHDLFNRFSPFYVFVCYSVNIWRATSVNTTAISRSEVYVVNNDPAVKCTHKNNVF
jgi:hypothetical protein